MPKCLRPPHAKTPPVPEPGVRYSVDFTWKDWYWFVSPGSTRLKTDNVGMAETYDPSGLHVPADYSGSRDKCRKPHSSDLFDLSWENLPTANDGH